MSALVEDIGGDRRTGLGEERAKEDGRTRCFFIAEPRERAPVPAFVFAIAGQFQSDRTLYQIRVMNAVDARKNDEAWLRGGEGLVQIS